MNFNLKAVENNTVLWEYTPAVDDSSSTKEASPKRGQVCYCIHFEGKIQFKGRFSNICILLNCLNGESGCNKSVATLWCCTLVPSSDRKVCQGFLGTPFKMLSGGEGGGASGCILSKYGFRRLLL